MFPRNVKPHGSLSKFNFDVNTSGTRCESGEECTHTDVGTVAGCRVNWSGAHVADTPGPDGSTPPIMACTQGILDDVKLWLDYGTNPALEGKAVCRAGRGGGG